MKLTIRTGNAAFEDGGYEVARLLREAADKIEALNTSGVLFDINGNRVGEYSL